VAACWALRRELSGLRAADLLAALRGYGASHVALGLACTAASFLVLGAIELIALRSAGDVPPGAVPPTISQSVGLALLTGAAVRVRAYGRRGLDAVAVARVTGFATLTTTLGLLAAGAVALLASTAPLRLHGHDFAVRPVGAVLAAIVLAYLAWSALGRGTAVGRGRWRLLRPSPALAAAQVGLSAFDWLVTGTVLYAFLPAGIGYWPLLRAYMIAQTVGVTSHVPGGVGVLELVLLAVLAGTAPVAARTAVTAALVMFRVVYYLVPLVAAMLVAGVAELRRSAGRPVAAIAGGAGAR
jgi:phosphatidylglycerol lysyltransferase